MPQTVALDDVKYVKIEQAVPSLGIYPGTYKLIGYSSDGLALKGDDGRKFLLPLELIKRTTRGV